MAHKTQAENEAYWINRQRKLFEEVEKDEQNAQKRLFENLKREETRLEKEITAFYGKYANRDDVVEYRKLMVGAEGLHLQIQYLEIQLFRHFKEFL